MSGSALGVTLRARPRDCKAATDATLRELVNKTTCLEFVNLQNVASVSDETVFSMLRLNKGVKGLNLNGCSSISDTVLRGVAQYCKHLMHLNLKGCELVTDRGLLVRKGSAPVGLRVVDPSCSAGTREEEFFVAASDDDLQWVF